MAARKKVRRKKKVVRMSEESVEATGSTPVTIGGRTYHLRGHSDPGYLRELAALVDAKMREVAEITGTVDTQKVAILAALNFADECLQAGRKDVGGRSKTGDAEKRLARLVTLLDEALAG